MYKLKLTDIYKQLKEEEATPTEPAQQYKIYCDMDGVIADFDKRFKDVNPEKLSAAQYQTKYGIEKFWDLIDEENKVKFWVGIPWMSDGKQLWDYIKDKQPTLLSAPSKKPQSRLGKRLWVKNNMRRFYHLNNLTQHHYRCSLNIMYLFRCKYLCHVGLTQIGKIAGKTRP